MEVLAGHLITALILLAILRKLWQAAGRPGARRPELRQQRRVRRQPMPEPPKSVPVRPKSVSVRSYSDPGRQPGEAWVANTPKASQPSERDVLIQKFMAQHRFSPELAATVVDKILAGQKDAVSA
jgi:hypothetical protein